MLSYSLPKTQRTHRNIITLAEMLLPIHYSAWLRVCMRAQWEMRMRNLQALETGISEWNELRQTELGWGCLWSSNTRMKLTTVYTRYIYSIYSVCVFVYMHIFTVVKNLPANTEDAGDTVSIPGSGRSPGVENGNPLQYSCLGNPMNRGAWQTTVQGVATSWTPVRD